MSRKVTPKNVQEIVHRHFERLCWIQQCIKTKRTLPEESQADWLKQRSVGELEWMAYGANAAVEDVLHVNGCYHGFVYLSDIRDERGEDGQLVRRRVVIGPDAPDYNEWMRQYNVRKE